MAQRAARSEMAPEYGSFSGRLEDLGPDWLVIEGRCLRGAGQRGAPPVVLVHPARGIAVLDVAPPGTPGAVEAVHARLEAARFPAIFSGHLPVVHLRAPPRQMPFLPDLLDDAFAAEPPLRLPGGDAWVSAAARALIAEQPAPRVGSQRFRGGRRRRWASAVRTAAAGALCLVALGGVVAMVAGGGGAPVSAPAPGPVAAVVGAAAVDPSTAGSGAPAEPPPASSPALQPAPVGSPPPPARSPVEAATPSPPAWSPVEAAPPPPAAERAVTAPPLPPSAVGIPGTATPQRAAPPAQSRRQEATAPPPPARKPPERTTPRRQQQQQQEASGTWPSVDGPAAPSPEAGAQRCRRITALIGLGAPLDEDDIRFFNEGCIRW